MVNRGLSKKEMVNMCGCNKKLQTQKESLNKKRNIIKRIWNQAKNELIASMREMLKANSRLIASVADADMQDEGDEMEKVINESFNPLFLMRAKIGCIVGTHLGPGLAVAFYEEWTKTFQACRRYD